METRKYNMNFIFILTILVIGLSGLSAQVLILRELLVGFYGNELTLGIILANWIISEAMGVFIVGKMIERIKNKINVFLGLQVLFSVILPLAIYLSRTFKNILGIPFGEGIGLNTIFYASFFIIFPLGSCHGALFSTAAKIYSLHLKAPARSIGRVYTWETIGTILGGIILTYLLIPHLNSFQIVFIIAIANLVLCLFFLKDTTARLPKYIISLLIIVAGLFSFMGGINHLQKISINKQWRPQRVLEYRNSIYGNIVVTKKEGQYTFFYNGIPAITAPYPDITFVQEFGNLPLLFSKDPKDILIISAGAGGLINEALKHPVRRIDYAELDPLLIKLLEKYPSDLTQRELTDPRVNIVNLDGRFFVKNTTSRYDIVLIGSSKPQDLSTNRLFTREFFALAHKRLNNEGILAFCLPGSLSYLTQELKNLNACILNGLKDVYAYVRVIPGDYNMFLASDSRDILEVNPSLITQRLKQDNIKPGILLPGYLEYRLNSSWQDWFQGSLADATRQINQDLRPSAVFGMLMLWNKQFSPALTYVFKALSNLNLIILSLLISAITLILIYHRRNDKLIIAYSLATTGFFGMLALLILIFSFQVFYGYLYHKIGILMSVFMAGIALGSIIATKFMERIKNSLALFIRLEIAVALFSFVLPWLINNFGGYLGYAYGFFLSLFFIPGLLMGLEFPLASKIYLGQRDDSGRVAGILYSADLIGGWFAGVLGGILLLPVLGLFDSCMLMVCLKASSLLLLCLLTKARI